MTNPYEPPSDTSNAALRADVIPRNLYDLVALAERWGRCGDSGERDELAAAASPGELADLSRQLRGRHDEIADWLYSRDDESPSNEGYAFSQMILFELEHCDGPGITGLLQWALRRYREAPSDERRERLADAYRKMRPFKSSDHLRADMHAAQKILGIASE